MTVTKVFAGWQSGLETVSGCRQWKLRLELPLSPSRALPRRKLSEQVCKQSDRSHQKHLK